ncbi:phosphotransferase enzyme family protein [Pseudactinotalea terrae]|uniref:phosphotransferase enzyme family protein n=1 Tax=Pseudactinotalea terrae TaxID=1743262 RepID=UPI001391AC40|nr:phosphotransferase [Pseudactinotalea terrae]
MLGHAATEILPRFGFAASDIDDVVRVPQRIKNVNYRVRAEGADWVLKRYDSPQAAARLEFAHQLEQGLAERGFPVAQLRCATDGRTLVSDETGTYSLHSWVDGRQISIDQRDETLRAHPEVISELAAALGRFHRLSSAMDLPEVTHRHPEELLRMPSRALRSSPGRRPRVSRELRLRLRPRKSEFDHWLLEHLPAIHSHAERLATTPISDRIDADDIVASHHDINWENLIFDDRFHLRALLDFDNATRVHRDLDVGLAAAVLVGPDPERLTTFLATYTAAAEHPVERAVVEIAIQLKCARSVIWSIDAYLGDRVADESMLATWCRHMYAGLDEVANVRHRALTLACLLTPVMSASETVGAALTL